MPIHSLTIATQILNRDAPMFLPFQHTKHRSSYKNLLGSNVSADPVLTQNTKKAGRAGRKQWKIRRANGGKKHKSEPKRLRFALETTYGPEGRGFESLTAYQKCQTEGLGTFVFTFLKRISVGRIPSAAHADSFFTGLRFIAASADKLPHQGSLWHIVRRKRQEIVQELQQALGFQIFLAVPGDAEEQRLHIGL